MGDPVVHFEISSSNAEQLAKFYEQAFGLTRVRLRDYVLASWIGMMPGTVMYVYIGSLARVGAAEYVAGQFRAAGLKTEFQVFEQGGEGHVEVRQVVAAVDREVSVVRVPGLVRNLEPLPVAVPGHVDEPHPLRDQFPGDQRAVAEQRPAVLVPQLGRLVVQVQVNERAGLTFASALRSIMRATASRWVSSSPSSRMCTTGNPRCSRCRETRIAR